MNAESKSQDENLLEVAREVLNQEASALKSFADSIGEDFLHAVKLICEIPPTGRIVFSGMGKAGLIGSKISATFASIGRPSFFLHPADAIHGDLGRLSASDLVILLSYSGETEEVVKLLGPLARMGASAIAITRSRNSSLGKLSEITIEIGEVDEAGPLGLAPTTSTAVMLGIGDALAMSYLKAQNFSPQEFASRHPGGNLGRSLMKVSELMRSGDELCLVKESSLTKDALKAIAETPKRPGAAGIVDDSGKLVGIFTDGDLRRLLAKDENFLSKPINEHMGKSPKSITGEKLVSEAIRELSEHAIDQLIVVDDENRPVGMLDVQDTLVLL